jgi:hypothetical protein
MHHREAEMAAEKMLIRLERETDEKRRRQRGKIRLHDFKRAGSIRVSSRRRL